MQQASFLVFTNGWPSIDVGRMRHAITIWQQGGTSPATYDAAGVAQQNTQVASAMAAIDTIRGTDVIKGGQTGTELYLTIGMWYQAGILPNMTVVSDNGSKYVIQSVENIREMNVVLILNCLGLGANE